MNKTVVKIIDIIREFRLPLDRDGLIEEYEMMQVTRRIKRKGVLKIVSVRDMTDDEFYKCFTGDLEKRMSNTNRMTWRYFVLDVVKKLKSGLDDE